MCWSPAPWPVLRIAVRRDYEQVQQVWNPDELIFLPGLILLRSCWTSCITRMWKLPNNSWGNMWVLKSAVKECECFIRTCDDDVFDEQEVLRCFWSVCRCQEFYSSITVSQLSGCQRFVFLTPQTCQGVSESLILCTSQQLISAWEPNFRLFKTFTTKELLKELINLSGWC